MLLLEQLAHAAILAAPSVHNVWNLRKRALVVTGPIY